MDLLPVWLKYIWRHQYYLHDACQLPSRLLIITVCPAKIHILTPLLPDQTGSDHTFVDVHSLLARFHHLLAPSNWHGCELQLITVSSAQRVNLGHHYIIGSI